jgi:hypothetical protein
MASHGAPRATRPASEDGSLMRVADMRALEPDAAGARQTIQSVADGAFSQASMAPTDFGCVPSAT